MFQEVPEVFSDEQAFIDNAKKSESLSSGKSVENMSGSVAEAAARGEEAAMQGQARKNNEAFQADQVRARELAAKLRGKAGSMVARGLAESGKKANLGHQLPVWRQIVDKYNVTNDRETRLRREGEPNSDGAPKMYRLTAQARQGGVVNYILRLFKKII